MAGDLAIASGDRLRLGTTADEAPGLARLQTRSMWTLSRPSQRGVNEALHMPAFRPDHASSSCECFVPSPLLRARHRLWPMADDCGLGLFRVRTPYSPRPSRDSARAAPTDRAMLDAPPRKHARSQDNRWDSARAGNSQLERVRDSELRRHVVRRLVNPPGLTLYFAVSPVSGRCWVGQLTRLQAIQSVFVTSRATPGARGRSVPQYSMTRGGRSRGGLSALCV